MAYVRSCALALLLTTASTLVAHAEQAAGSGAGPAPAGEAPSAAVQEVVVTGSRIPRINEKSANPVAVVTSQEVKLQGATHVEDLLNTLPQVNAGLNGSALGPTGTATVDLRGFGAFRTLVLINGRRLNPGDPINPSADLNSVPAPLVKRVEVLTGGASSIYGSDAIAGVVNFVMDDNFTGLQLDAQYGGFLDENNRNAIQALARANGYSPAHGAVFDGGTTEISATWGGGLNGDKGHLTLYAGYRHSDPVKASNRDYAACNLVETDTFFNCIHDDNSNPAHFILSNGQSVTLDAATPSTFRPYTTDPDGFNTAPYAYLSRPDTRYDAGLFARYAISSAFNLYAEFQFSDDRTTARYEPASTALNSFSINCGNPLLSANEVSTLCTQFGLGPADSAQVTLGKRSVETGPRLDSFEHTSYRGVIGLKGRIDKVWSYDAFAQYGITYSSELLTNDLSLARVQNGLNVVPVNGAPTCQSVVDGTDPSCVPYNIFQIGGVTQAAANYVGAFGTQHGYAARAVLNGVLIGQLGGYGLKSPLASDGVGIVAGVEARRESLGQRPSAEYLTGDLAVTGPQLAFGGHYTVIEGFGEMHVPLVEDIPFIHTLSLDLSDRYAHYSLQGDVNAYKIGGDWAPTEDVRLRGSVSQAIRAPNGYELFKTDTVNKFQGSDPCAGPTPVATLAQCQNSGVTPGQYGNIVDTGNFNYVTGGNIHLRPETATTYTIGAVFTPRFIPAFSLSVDYWDITVNGYDGQYAPNATLNNCVFGGNPIFCALVQRDSSGSLSLGNGLASGRVIATNLNTGSFGERGIDFDSTYRLDLALLRLPAAGTITLHFDGSLALGNRIQPIPGGQVFDCTGLYGPSCTGLGPTSPVPVWRHQVRATWITPVRGLVTSVNWRHIGELKSELGSAYPILQGTVHSVDARIPPHDYFDLAVTYDVSNKYSLRAGIDNIFGANPPIVGSGNNPLILGGNMVSSMYDTLGRLIFVGVTARY